MTIEYNHDYVPENKIEEKQQIPGKFKLFAIIIVGFFIVVATMRDFGYYAGVFVGIALLIALILAVTLKISFRG